MGKEELKLFISTIRTTGNFDTSRLIDSEKTCKVEEKLNQNKNMKNYWSDLIMEKDNFKENKKEKKSIASFMGT